MNTPARYALLLLLVVVMLHAMLSLTHELYGRATSLSAIKSVWRGDDDADGDYLHTFHPVAADGEPLPPAAERRASAVLLMTTNEGELSGVVRSVRKLEDRFNAKYQYPWVLLSEEPLSDTFQERIKAVTSANVSFGLIPEEQRTQPRWIDEVRAKTARDDLEAQNIIFGGSVPYRNMCRYQSGFFFNHPLVLPYEWYWRVDQDVDFLCDINFDPFLYMQDQNKTFGFTMTLYEFRKTIPSLWDTVQEFKKDFPEHIAPGNSLDFLSDDGGKTYNLCHFWSNFEIGSLAFFRSAAYAAFFRHLDRSGGFYYERWAEAPVHSLAVGLLAPKRQIHFFDEIGYHCGPYSHCPRSEEMWTRGRCGCDQKQSFDYDSYSCLAKWDRAVGRRQ